MTSTQHTAANGRRNLLTWLLLLAGLIHVVLVLLLASVPPVSRDALNHHLAVPKMYLLQGGIVEIPTMHFSYFPMNLDLLYLLPLAAGFDIGAKYLHFSFALLTAALLYRYLRHTLDRTCGLLGALLFLTVPVVVKLSVTAYVDLGLIFFSFACLFFFLRWCDTNFRTAHLVAAGVACGLALGTKYNGLILLLIMAALIPLVYSRQRNQQVAAGDHRERNKQSLLGLLQGGIFVLVALLVFSPWMVRNTLWTGNPVYPLYNSVFNPPAQEVSADEQQEKEPPRNAFWQRKNIYNESFLQTITIPVRAFFQGQDDNPKYFDGKLNPFLLLLPLAAFVRRKGDAAGLPVNHRNILALFAAAYILFVLFQTDFRIRYMAPAIPPLVVLAVAGAYNLLQWVSGWSRLIGKIGRAGVALVLLLAFAYNGQYLVEQFSIIRPLDYLTGKVDRDGYVSRFRTEHPVMVRANAILPEEARVLCLSIGDRTYYLDRRAHLAEDFYDQTGGDYDEEQIEERMMRHGTTHIIFNRAVFLDWASQLPEYDRATFENVFSRRTKLLYEENGVQLLELLPTGVNNS